MMGEIELLTSVIEFSIGLAGFSGVVAAMNRTAGWSPLEKYRVVNLMQTSLAPAFLSFVALGLAQLQSNSLSAWQQSCLISAITMFGFVLVTFRGRASLPLAQRRELRMGVMYLITSCMVIIGVFQLFGAAGALSEYTFVLFYGGLVAFLLFAVFLFSVAIFAGRQADAENI